MEPTTEKQARVILDRFKKRSEDVPKILAALSRIDINRYPNLKGEYYSLLRRGRILIGKNSKVMSDIKSGYQFSRGVVGLQGLGDMGFLPLLIWGIIAASTAGTSKYAYDAYALNKKMSEQQRLEQEGLTPGQASAVISGQAVGWIERIGKSIILPVAAIIGAVYIGSRLIKRKRRA